MLDQLQYLATRLEGLSGPDRDVDCGLEQIFFGGDVYVQTAQGSMEPTYFVKRPSANHLSGFAKEPVYPYTASLDAAVALVVRLYPAYEIVLAKQTSFKHGVYWSAELGDGLEVEAPTAPLALLRALVSAKIEEAQARRSHSLSQLAESDTEEIMGIGHE